MTLLIVMGFEPTKHMQAILSRSPLTAREHYLNLPHVGLEPTTSRLEVGCAIQLRQ
jgi:hypothetical protein